MNPERLEVVSIELAGAGTITDNPTYAVASVNKPNHINTTGLTPTVGFGSGPGLIPATRADGWTIEVDGILPYISSVSSTTDDGTYGIGDEINITINFNEEVWYTQTLSVPVTGLASNLIFASVLETDIATTASVNHTIVAGDDSNGDPIVVNENATIVASGTVKDAPGNILDESNPGGLPLPASSNLTNVPDLIIVDGARPADPLSVTLAPHGGSATFTNASDYAEFFNTSNTHLKVTVGFDATASSDGTMENGAVYLEANINNAGWASLTPDGSVDITNDSDVRDGSSRECYRISPTDWTNITSGIREAEILIELNTLAILSDPTHSGSTLAQGELHGYPIAIRAKLLDNANNLSSSFEDGTSTLAIDTTPIVFQSVTSSTDDGDYGLGYGVNIRVNFNGTGSLIGGDLEIDHNGSTADFEINPMTLVTEGTDFYVQGTYTVPAGDVTYPDFLDVEEITLGNGAKLLDAAGNSTTVFTIDPDNSLDEPHKIVIDAQVPADFDVGEVITVTEAVVAGKWNSYNTKVQINVPIPPIANTSPPDDDGSLEGGTVQVLSKLDDGEFANLGSSHTIVGTDISITLVIEIDDEILGSTKGIEEIDDFADGKTITFSAIITDKFGNATTGTASTTTLFVDVTVPDIDNILTTIPLTTSVIGNNVSSIAVDNFWNINTDELTVNLGNLVTASVDDYLLDGGTVQLRGEVDGKGVLALGSPEDITLNNQTDFSISVMGIVDDDGTGLVGVEELSSHSDIAIAVSAPWVNMDGKDISIQVRITDKAGNYTDWPTVPKLLKIDGMDAGDQPTISAAAFNQDGWWGPNSNVTILIILTTSGEITVTTNNTILPTIDLETGSTIGTATYASSTTTELSFEYNPEVGETTVNTVNGQGQPLQFRLNARGEPVINLNGENMYEESGNFLVSEDLATSNDPVIPQPTTNLIIDGVKPDDFTVDVIATYDVLDNRQVSGYYNGNVH